MYDMLCETRRFPEAISRSMLTAVVGATALVAGCISQPTGPAEEAAVPADLLVASIAVSPQDPVVAVGQTVRFSAKLKDAQGKELKNKEVEWESEDDNISNDGVYRAPHAPGRKKIKASHRNNDREVSDSTWVRVADPAEEPAPTRLVLIPGTMTVQPGDVVDFVATLYAADGSVVAGVISWSATGGTVDEAGRYTAADAAGSFAVVAASGDVADTANVEITAPAPAPPPDNEAPSAAWTWTCNDLDCSFDASGSDDPDGSIVSHAWSFGDGSSGSGESALHSYSDAGTFQVQLTVTDDDGAADVLSRSVTVQAADGPPFTGVEVPPGQSGQYVQSLIDSHPAGTAFLLKAGVHPRQQITPKNGTVLVGEPGAVLDGEGVTPWAIRGTADDVEIRGLEITGYTTPAQEGVVAAGWDDGLRWVVEDNEIHHNGGAGLFIGHDMIARGNHLHHNGQFGLMGFGHRALIENNEISYNNTDGHDPFWAAGAMKIFYSDDVVFRGNHVHHNYGFGIWFDHDNERSLIENNLVENNDYAGIYHEVNPSGEIRGNTVTDNGWGPPAGTFSTAGIGIANSMNVEVHGNTLSGNRHGIMGVEQDRSAVANGPWHTENLWVHDNDVTMQSGGSGLRNSGGNGQVHTSNNRFDNNVYRVTGNASPFWRDSPVDAATWTGSGQDANSTIHP